MYKKKYKMMFGSEYWVQTYNSVYFFQTYMDALVQHWMCMTEIGVLIASKYNVIFHVLSMTTSTTYFPFRSEPPPWYQHVVIVIGHVNNNHYVKVVLSEGYPMPTISPHWNQAKYNCAAKWTTLYRNRLNLYM